MEINEINQIKKSNKIWLDTFRGCLLGGAIGDALGYPVEFLSSEEIFRKYGSNGIQKYCLSNGKALISDDTQMTLFTATGLLLGYTRGALRGIMGKPETYIGLAYRDWYKLQVGSERDGKRYSWLCDVPEMRELRAPGNTCLSALAREVYGSVAEPINQSKGCGGIMRVAPVGLYLNRQPEKCDRIERVDKLAAEVSALTHGHELGYLPAAALAHIINRITYSGCKRGSGLKNIVLESMDYLRKLYFDKNHLDELCSLIEKAVNLSINQIDDLDNIRALGEGWVAEETLAIAIYCCLKYEYDFSTAVCVAVNHDGDSDSTGAVTGNILGAWIGYEKIPMRWKEKLECADIILEVADDLCYDCLMTEYGDYRDDVWIQKYVHCSR